MKFIKATGNWYVDLKKVDSFTIQERTDEHFTACAYIGEARYALAIFNTHREAQAYLDKLVAELNAVKSCGD